MTWWMWVLLAVIMIAALALGIAYAVIHAIRAAKSVARVSAQISEHTEPMSDPADTAALQAPSFTRPFAASINAYSAAHADVIARREARAEQHARTWEAWLHSHD